MAELPVEFFDLFSLAMPWRRNPALPLRFLTERRARNAIGAAALVAYNAAIMERAVRRRQAALALLDESTHAFSAFIRKSERVGELGLHSLGSGRTKARDAGGFVVQMARRLCSRLLLLESEALDIILLRRAFLQVFRAAEAFALFYAGESSDASTFGELVASAIRAGEVALDAPPFDVDAEGAGYTFEILSGLPSASGRLLVYYKRIRDESVYASAPELRTIELIADGAWHHVEAARYKCTVGSGWYKVLAAPRHNDEEVYYEVV